MTARTRSRASAPAPVPDDAAAVLRALLDDGARFDADYQGELANHLPMALVSLRALGADAGRLRAFAQRYARQLEPARPGAAWPSGDAWTGRFGDAAAWPAYRSLFGQWLQAEGLHDMLLQVLPALMPGCGAAAFHGLIRTACGVRAGHAGEIVDGLAHWAARWLPLHRVEGRRASAAAHGVPVSAGDRIADVADALLALPPARRGAAAEAGLIAERMAAAAARRGFDVAVAALQIDAQTLPQLTRHAASLYAASGNFTVLHLVTASHATGLLLSFADQPLVLVGHFWRAYAAGHVASRLRTAGPAPEPLPWNDIVAAARDSDDEHVIKLVDATRALEAGDSAGPWRAAATRAVAHATAAPAGSAAGV